MTKKQSPETESGLSRRGFLKGIGTVGAVATIVTAFRMKRQR